jgi:hypothetical protein
MSYGWAELKQCDIAYMPCINMGITSTQYVARTNLNFKKLAVMGTTIFVSDGDDGAQGVQPDGTNPIDPDHWCPDEYTCYPHTSTKTVEFTLRNTTTGKTCPLPVGQYGDACEWIFLGDFYQMADVLKALQDQNPTCDVDFFFDSSYGTHMYSACAVEDMSLAHEDTVLEPYKFDSKARLFYADFPTSSPFVTSVGATVFHSSDGSTVSDELGASILNGAIITTGGGFSAIEVNTSTIAWQKDATQAWSEGTGEKPPSNQYDITNRGYPDVTLNGHNYQVVYSVNGDDSCPCKTGGVDGTSASSPALAGMVSLINGALLAAGKSQVRGG